MSHLGDTNEMELIASVRLSYIKQLEAEKEVFITRIKQLEEAGDRLLTVMRGEEDCAYCEWIALAHEADLKWHKAKKAKP